MTKADFVLDKQVTKFSYIPHSYISHISLCVTQCLVISSSTTVPRKYVADLNFVITGM
jgi:hypothetical protein